ncbi:hypothetical protein [Thalassococcus profundi]|nr:hypothetical protein [Thalassococcus profundi]
MQKKMNGAEGKDAGAKDEMQRLQSGADPSITVAFDKVTTLDGIPAPRWLYEYP